MSFQEKYPHYISATGFINLSLISNIFPFLFCQLVLDKELSYDHLASGLKAALEDDKSAFDADRLQKYTGNVILKTLVLLDYFYSTNSQVSNHSVSPHFAKTVTTCHPSQLSS